MIRNDRFRVALDYLYKNRLVADQRELSVKTGLSQKSISHILNNRVQNPSEATIRKLNEAFGNIFNPEYFRGQSIHLLVEDALYYEQHPEEDISSPKYVPFEQREKQKEQRQEMPTWADAMLFRQTEQQKEIEELRRMLKATLEKVDVLTDLLEKSIYHQRGSYIFPNTQTLATAEHK